MNHTTVEGVIRERLSTAMGGWRGSLEAALPTVAFVIAWNVTKNLRLSLAAAGAILVVALVLRLVQRSTPRFVVTALFATAIAAYLSNRSGHASDVFLPGLIQSGAMCAAAPVSILIRWPMVGFFVAAGDPNMAQDPLAWRRSAAMIRVCTRLTWVFFALFAIRLAIMVPLYLANNITALGVCKIVLGWPLYLGALAVMALMLAKGETPLAEHDALLHEDAEGQRNLHEDGESDAEAASDTPR